MEALLLVFVWKVFFRSAKMSNVTAAYLNRMLNVLLPGTKFAIPLYADTYKIVVCIYPSAIERFYDKQGNETEMVVIKQEGIRLV